MKERLKTSTEIASAARTVGEEKAIELIAKAGFDAWDFSMWSMCGYDWKSNSAIASNHPLAGAEYAKFAKHLKSVGLNNGIVCNQSHAPFPSSCREIRSYFKRAIECTAIAGGQICIIHPDNNKSPEENGEMYLELLPYAKEHGVKIAAENMWNWDSKSDCASFAACATPESFLAHLNAVNDDFLVACLDIGHAEMRGLGTCAIDMIYALKGKLSALHIHDNDKWKDSHQLPFTMEIDFDKVVAALKEIGYNGYLTLEADRYLTAYSAENVFCGIKKMADTAKRISEMFSDANCRRS